MTSFSGMVKQLENIFRDEHKSHQISVICCWHAYEYSEAARDRGSDRERERQ